jgi:ABC-type Fe3+/spermidine/putrescine transport system ATPase subunit
MNIIELHEISLNFGDTQVLNNLSLTVEKGERLVIFGPSGCGKTSILRLIAGFIAPDSGTIKLNGRTVAGNGRVLVPPQHRGVSMVFQDLALWPHFTTAQNLDFVLKAAGTPRAERRERIRAMLELVDLPDLANRKPGELSGGQRQRVALARALITNPAVLLMDEPLTALHDDLNRRLRREIIRLHQQTSTTIIYVTHNRSEAAEIATRTITLKIQ